MLQLVTRRDEVSKEVVSILEKYLAMAQRGEIIAIAVAAVEPSGAATHQAGTNDCQIQLLGAVTRLLHRMNLVSDTVTTEES